MASGLSVTGAPMERLKKRISDWYEGRFVPHINEPDALILLLGGTYERHWTAQIARVFFEFLRIEWKWSIATAIAIAALYIAWRKL
jgi:hypothetical protein